MHFKLLKGIERVSLEEIEKETQSLEEITENDFMYNIKIEVRLIYPIQSLEKI